ncbi:QCR10 protein, partial [Cardinalis cardinalis]|uniref:QCR10 protein n=5 Tax=Passeriformes TaxID=9126 RepID=A0A8C5J7Q3_JUNHY|nr:cytochrome b-c1 complex subunit 10 [Melozone crissalis]XP_057896648.1 cytochrome b-c1 complex subunit 10 [Melospiza georgiana]XP_058677190.1 cytochrome b-c1 complex subunit 10 [Ammospiza caudacuta]XP_059345778.1 cytochrome b-c1 complex subunit 10 [Ammospiza nelsoni]NWR23773.1 QCR10 protein [Emberiza fucata]NWT30429.1 QCR10 protein [Cardinalis cardinalis]NWZ93155.1 QCR10 protein [Nesospiza acunhae]
MLNQLLGPRYAELLRTWTPTLATWGGVAGIGVIWATDWKLVLQYVPYIGGKYKTED